jgi:hypothetical protein
MLCVNDDGGAPLLEGLEHEHARHHIQHRCANANELISHMQIQAPNQKPWTNMGGKLGKSDGGASEHAEAEDCVMAMV